MKNNVIKDFFDKRADNWDLNEKKDFDFFNKFVKENIKINKTDLILDLACGTGVITNILAKYTNNRVLGLDISTNMILKAKEKENLENTEFLNEDFYNLEGFKFDLIVCHNAYPHFMDKLKFKEQCSKLLNENGRLIICHSISRNEVNKCHSDKMVISTKLDTVENEFKKFSDLFSLIRLYEDENIYVIEMKKK